MATKVSLNIPSKLWTQQDSARLGLNTLASIKLRTSRGIDANGKSFKKYSTKPIYIGLKSNTAKRLKPKGGRKTKRSMYFKGGYAEYKKKSRKRTKGPNVRKAGATRKQSSEVDLVLSGQLMQNFVLKSSSSTGFTLGLTKHVSHYGYHVNKKREYLGLTKQDVDVLVEAVTLDLMEKLS